MAIKDWERIRQLRTDTSQYVMHCTHHRWDSNLKRTVQPHEVLTEILTDGFLKAGFSRIKSPLASSAKPRIRGPYPAVCFTEQPLQFFLQTLSAKTSTSRYSPFAIALRKDDLFDYGGRPVIYTDEWALGDRVPMPEGDEDPWIYDGGLPKDMQYLWVGYGPADLWYRSYPNDWTHEREWRAKPDVKANSNVYMGPLSQSAVPLLLPTGRPNASNTPRFIILVDKQETVHDLTTWIADKLAEISGRGPAYWISYAKVLESAPILSFELAKTILDGSGNQLGRLEDFFPL